MVKYNLGESLIKVPGRCSIFPVRAEFLIDANILNLVFWRGLPCNFLDRYLSAELRRVISQKTGLLIWVSVHHHLLGLYLEAESSQIMIVTTHSLQIMELTIHFYQMQTLRMCGV